MKANPDKFHVLFTSNVRKNITFSGEKVKKIHNEKVLSITVDRKLEFNAHVHKIFDSQQRTFGGSSSIFFHKHRQEKSINEGIYKFAIQVFPAYMDIS